ncbi:hypothetical protein B0H19DRAFT_952466, partial [Mycena capillaripes]
MEALKASFSALGSNLRPRRLFYEDDEVEGCGWFHKRPERTFHVLGNILRLIFTLLLSPFYLFTPRVVTSGVSNYFQSSWLLEYAATPDSVLSNARSGGKGEYDVTNFRPSWILEVKVRNGAFVSLRQIPFSEEVADTGYTALS